MSTTTGTTCAPGDRHADDGEGRSLRGTALPEDNDRRLHDRPCFGCGEVLAERVA